MQTSDGSRMAADATAVDRIIALLTGCSLLVVYLLPSQSGASFATYLLALLVFTAGRERWREFAESRELSAMLCVVLLFFSASVWWSTEPSPRGAFSIYSRCLLVLTFVVALSTSLRRVPGFAQYLTRALAVIGGIAAVAAVIDFCLHPTWDGRLVGLGQLDNSVVAALTFNAALLFALNCAISDATWWRVAGAVSAMTLALAIALTGSRNGYLGTTVGVGILLVSVPRRRASRGRLWLTAPALGAAAMGIALAVARPDWLAALFPRGGSFRLEIWSAEWQRLLVHGPWFGLGILTGDDVVVNGQVFSHPHSLYLASALQGGLVGLLLLLGLLTCAAWRLFRARDLWVARLGMALLATGVSTYLFDGWELIDKVGLSWLLLWTPVAIAVAVGMTSNMGNTLRMMAGLNTPGHGLDAGGRQL